MNETIIRALAQGFVALAEVIKERGNDDTREVLAGYEALVDAVRDSGLPEGADLDQALEELERSGDRLEDDRKGADEALRRRFQTNDGEEGTR